MRKLPLLLIILTVIVGAVMPSCGTGNDNDSWTDAYSAWRDSNEVWLQKQMARKNPDGTPYYKTVVPAWDPAAYVLIHYFNDRSQTAGNLMPLSTSTIDTRYIVHYYNGVALDSSYTQTKYGPGIFRTKLNQVIQGWTIAFEDMHVGDTAEIVIPYAVGYGVSSSSSVPPYSNLLFNASLVDIPYYETNSKQP